MQTITKKWAKETAGVLQRTAAGMMSKGGNVFAELAIKQSIGNLVKVTATAFAATFATAGTGTAISSLSGAAAKSALLAWFGGGSMAVGSVTLLVIPFASGWLGWKLLSKKIKRDPKDLTEEEAKILHRCWHFASFLRHKAKGKTPELTLSSDEADDIKQLGADILHYLSPGNCRMESVRKRTTQNHKALSKLLAGLD